MLKFNKDTRTTPLESLWCLIIDFEHISHLALLLLLLTLSRKMTAGMKVLQISQKASFAVSLSLFAKVTGLYHVLYEVVVKVKLQMRFSVKNNTCSECHVVFGKTLICQELMGISANIISQQIFEIKFPSKLFVTFKKKTKEMPRLS